MVANSWGTATLNDFLITGDAGDQFNPSVADSGGGSFGVAWTSSTGVTVRFYDVVGQVDPALGTIVLSDGTYAATADAAIVSNVSLTAGGAVGYAAVWEETSASNASAPSVLRGRYVGLASTVGNEFSILAEANVAQHDVSTSGYFIDGANRKPVVDGFNVVWVSTGTTFNLGLNAEGLTQAQVDAGYGRIMLQRFAVPLDNKVDPIGPPAAAGLDGNVGGASDAAVNVGNEAGLGATVVGRDPATITTHDGETIVSWIDLANQVHVRVYGLTGNVINVPGINLANIGTVTGAQEVRVVDLAGAGFAVAWVATVAGAPAIVGRVFAGAAGAFAASAVTTLQTLPAGFTGDWSMGTLIDTGGFSISWTESTGTGLDVKVASYDSNGISDGTVTTVNTTTAGDQSHVALGGLVGDRVIAVYQDDPTAAAGDQNIRAAILDTRLDGLGNPIVENGVGLTINGDDGGNGRVKPIADVLVGTIGNDTINGLASADELHGALGNDTLDGGAGNDILDGEGNGLAGDTAVFTGVRANYTIDHLGGGLFQVTDNRAGSPDGSDTLRGIENITFLGSGETITTQSLLASIVPITPTAWGWTDEDADNNPNPGSPDVDGMIVNRGLAGDGGIDANVSIADSVGEFVAVAWERTAPGGSESHIFGQFYDVIGAPDSFIPNTLALSDGIGNESNAVVTSGGANSGWGVTFEQLDAPGDTTHTLRTNFVGPGQLTGPELTVLDEGNLVDQHDAAMFGSFLDRTLANPVAGSALPAAMNDGYNVAWVSTDVGGGAPAGYGRIMFQRFEVPLDALGNPGAAVAGGIDGIASLGSDAATQLAALGRNPSTTSLHTFETAVIWIEQDGAGGERIAGKVYDDLGNEILVPGFDDISAGFPVAPGTTAHIVSAGAVNLGIVWVTPDNTSPSGLTVVGTMYASTGAGLGGVGFSFVGPPQTFVLKQLPAGTNTADLQFAATSISGEDSNDIVVSWKSTGASGDDIHAQHIAVALDPITGGVISMGAEGNEIRVNAESSGDQNGGVLAGLLGDRFIEVWHDTNASYTDGNDIVARIIDTRDAVNPEPITGDLVRAGTPQARRDVLIGTNGDDTIKGDISDSNGLTDYIYAGMGNDTIQGGPGLRGAAGIPEIIDGGDGFDTSVYTGRLQDYSITVNGDGSLEVIDLRPTAILGVPQQHDGIDNLYSIERLHFLDSAHGGASELVLNLSFPGTPPAPPPNYDGTPVAWSLDDESVVKEVNVDTTAGTTGISVINLQDGAAAAWVSGGGTQVWAISYDVTGKPDPILLGANTQLTDGGAGGVFADNTVSDIELAMTGGLGVTAVWESTDTVGNDSGAGDTSLHLAFASTNTHFVIDPNGGVPGPGLPGGEIVVVGSDGAGVADGPVVQGYEIVDNNNDTLEVGFHVGFVMKANAGATYGALTLARYEIPVYDIAVDANGLPVLDGAGQGSLAVDGFGNLVPSTTATFGTGSETAPISIGLDGLRGTGDDNAAIVLTDLGLFAANAVPVNATVLQGRDISIGSLHDGQLVVTYIGSDEQVHLKVFLPTINQAGDRETTAGNLGSDIVAQGITSYSEFALPFSTNLGAVASGQTAFVVPQQNGSFGVFWAEAGGVSGTIDIKGIIYSGAGTNWSPSGTISFATGLAAGTHFQVAITGVTPGGLEDGFFVSWESNTGILGQRFDMTGTAVGQQITVGDPTAGTAANHSSTGIDDGRMLVGYVDGDHVAAQFLDNREPGIALIGPRNGAPADVIAGTVGDDAIDGRALNDILYGGLGNDLITMGSGADIGFGGKGNDQLIGGSGQDQLLGEDGDDLLWGGVSGPIDPQVDRDLVAGLTAAGVAPALIATDTGADIISGGAGIDTISYQSEFGNFNVDLSTGIVTSDRDVNGSFVLEDVIGQIVDDGAGGTIFSFINDIENAVGGFGDDVFTGNGGDNQFEGREGNDTLIGGGGIDKAVYDESVTTLAASMFSVVGGNWVVTTGTSEGTDTLIGMEIVDGNRFVLVGQSSGFATMQDAINSGTLFDGDIILTFNGVTVVQTVYGNSNHQPEVVNDNAVVAEDVGTTINVLANDTDPDLDALSIDAATLTASHGTVSVAAGGILYTPDADYFGSDTITYRIKDTPASGTALYSDFGTVNVTVTNTEDVPTDIVFSTPGNVNNQSVNENSAAGTLLASMTTIDPDNTATVSNDAFTYSLQDTFGGRFEINGNQLRLGNVGLDFEARNTYTLTVTTNDGKGGTRTETFNVDVQNVDEAATGGIDIAAARTGSTQVTLSAVNTLVDPDILGPVNVAYAWSGGVNGPANVVNAQLAAVQQFTLSGTYSDPFGLKPVSAPETAIIGRTVASTLAGTSGADLIFGFGGDDTINGNDGADLLDGGGGSDTVAGGLGRDTLVGGAGADDLSGNDDDDVFLVAAGDLVAGDKINGGAGTDELRLGSGTHSLVGVQLAELESITFSASGATIVTIADPAQTSLIKAALGANDTVIYNGFLAWPLQLGLAAAGVENVQSTNGNGTNVVHFVNGKLSTLDITYLPSNTQFENATLTYNTETGALISNRTLFDNGVQDTLFFTPGGLKASVHKVDTLDAFNWSEQHFTYAANGTTLVSLLETYDAEIGGSLLYEYTSGRVTRTLSTQADGDTYDVRYTPTGVLLSTETVDVSHSAASYQSIKWDYVGGVLAKNTVIQDNGERVVTNYTNGVRTSVEQYDDGNHFAYASVIKFYTAAGQVASSVHTMDTGFRAHYSGAAGATLTGNGANESFTGVAGVGDTFVFGPTCGNDYIANFENGRDKLDLSAFHFSSFSAVNALAVGGVTNMHLYFADGGHIAISGLTKATFDASDVIL